MTRASASTAEAEGRARSPARWPPTAGCSAQGTVTPERESARRGRRTTTRRSSTSATSRGWPPGRHDDPAVHELVRARSRDRSISAIHEGPATLELHDAPGEEHAALAPVRVGKGFRFTFAYTVDDLETVREV